MNARVVAPLGGVCAWKPADLQQSTEWEHTLDDGHIAELDAALAGLGDLDWPDVGAADLPMPRLGALLERIATDLEHGFGVARLRGFPVDRYPDADLRRLWAGIGRHLGTLVHQNPDGQLMRRITNEGADVGERYGQVQTPETDEVFLSSRARVASTGPLRFHTDRADVVGLLCVRPARAGGTSRIASSVAVHDEMVRRRPDLAALLYEDIHRSQLGEERGGEAIAYPLPVFGVRDDKFTSHYSRTYVEAAQMMPGVPKLTAAHWEALDLLAELADTLCVAHTFAAGDIQLLNNHVIYHSRTAYEDPPGQDRGRLLYRLWISTPNSRALPAGHEVLWQSTAAGAVRGGIRTAPR